VRPAPERPECPSAIKLPLWTGRQSGFQPRVAFCGGRAESPKAVAAPWARSGDHRPAQFFRAAEPEAGARPRLRKKRVVGKLGGTHPPATGVQKAPERWPHRGRGRETIAQRSFFALPNRGLARDPGLGRKEWSANSAVHTHRRLECKKPPSGDRTVGEVGRPSPSAVFSRCRTGGWRETRLRKRRVAGRLVARDQLAIRLAAGYGLNERKNRPPPTLCRWSYD
jgi:hypothetical protein